MPAIRRKFVLGLAVLLAAATAAADTVITAKEVISCSVVSADTNFVRLKLPRGGIRMLNTRDIHEIRLSDSSRVAELAAQLPGLEVTPDSAQPAPPPSVPASSLPCYAGDSTRASPVVPAEAPKPAVPDAIRPATLLTVELEAGAGCLGGLGLTLPASLAGALVGIWIAGNHTDFPGGLFAAIDGSNVGALVGYAAGNALGVSVVGRRFDQGGHLWASACGALARALVALPLFSVDSMHTPLVMALPLLPMVGAVLGYNLSRPRPAPTGSFLDRVEMPAVALWQDAEQQALGANVRLVSVRF